MRARSYKLYGKVKVFEEVMTALENEEMDKESFYFLNGHDAVVHMCKVASGIDSQVLGEQEILGQFKKALKKAKEINIVNGKLLKLSNKVLEISKKARTKTNIGLNSLSVSGLAYKLVKNINKGSQENLLPETLLPSKSRTVGRRRI